MRSRKLELRAFPSRDLHAKVYISKFRKDDRDYGRVITGSSNFSENGLNSQYEFNVELKNSIDVKYAQEKFDNLWAMSVDLTETYIDTINDKTWLNDTIKPYTIQIKVINSG
ncbi:MAG: phospholipase D-like domain-containing protein [Candidatus Gastranaerophilaceae bacterium]